MPLKNRLHSLLFDEKTRSAYYFDLTIIFLIISSVFLVILSSVSSLYNSYRAFFESFEWFITIVFTFEYVLRLICSKRPLKYGFSFYGIIDLFSILPTYISLFLTGANVLLIMKILRVMRIFRILKLAKYLTELDLIVQTLKQSAKKIIVFLFFVILIVTLLGSLMYVIEGEQHGFTNIPISIYWAIVTLTTVGYGDMSPQTGLGKMIASIVMILGYCIIAVPTGVVSAGFINKSKKN